jgi:N-acetylated-alpha-linked acidic dipeptidase
MNNALPRVETAFLSEKGLPGRSWYRHQLSAPGIDTGYDPLPLPALVEALRENNHASVTDALAELTAALQRATQTLTAALGGN